MRKNFNANSARRLRRYGRKARPVNRNRIIARDKSICYLCGRFIPKAFLVLDHVRPLARGGEHVEENLRVACRSCNSRKGKKLLHELSWVTDEIYLRAGMVPPATSTRLTEPELRLTRL